MNKSIQFGDFIQNYNMRSKIRFGVVAAGPWENLTKKRGGGRKTEKEENGKCLNEASDIYKKVCKHHTDKYITPA